MVVIIDYGLGNLRSVLGAVERSGGNVKISANHNEIENADKLILPGVGAFGDGIRNLKNAGLVEILNESVLVKKTPILGICLGAQLMTQESEEFGTHKGLGWIRASVKKISPADKKARVPHVGWNEIESRTEHKIWDKIGEKELFYFVHSFHMIPADKTLDVATFIHGESTYTAALFQDNIFAVQFHPEKSQKQGLSFISNFISIGNGS